MALYHAQPCAWDQLGSVGCHNFLKSFDEKTPLVELDHTLARKNDSPTWCGVIVVVWCYCGGVVLLW